MTFRSSRNATILLNASPSSSMISPAWRAAAWATSTICCPAPAQPTGDTPRSPAVTVSMGEIAAEEGITNYSNFFVNDPNAAIQWPFAVGVPITYGFGMRSGRTTAWPRTPWYSTVFHPLCDGAASNALEGEDPLAWIQTTAMTSAAANPAMAAIRRAPRPVRDVMVAWTCAMVATFPANLFLVVVEPLGIDRARLWTYVMGKEGAPRASEAPSTPGKGLSLVNDGGAEDQAMALAVQRGLESGANEFLEFGRFEGAIGHFHRNLHALLDGAHA